MRQKNDLNAGSHPNRNRDEPVFVCIAKESFAAGGILSAQQLRQDWANDL